MEKRVEKKKDQELMTASLRNSSTWVTSTPVAQFCIVELLLPRQQRGVCYLCPPIWDALCVWRTDPCDLRPCKIWIILLILYWYVRHCSDKMQMSAVPYKYVIRSQIWFNMSIYSIDSLLITYMIPMSYNANMWFSHTTSQCLLNMTKLPGDPQLTLFICSQAIEYFLNPF